MMQFPPYTCGSCIYFHQHYSRYRRGQYGWVSCGHCGHGRIKHRKPYTKACDCWQARQTG